MIRLSLVVPALLTAAFVSVAAPVRAQTLKVGSPAPEIKVGKWVKGDPKNLVKSGDHYTFAPGTVQVVEFWATWCVPCRQTIPHLTALAKQYAGKVSFTGISIREADPRYQEKVQRFVTEMGPKMDYMVGVDDDPDEGSMAKNWMTAAGAEAIPTAFIVGKDGNIAFIGHPLELEEPLELVVAGKWDPKAYADKQAKNQEEIKGVVELAQGGKFPEALTKLDGIETHNSMIRSNLALLRVQILVRTDETAATKYIRELGDGLFKEDPQGLDILAWMMVGEKSPWKTPDTDLAQNLTKRALALTGPDNPSILETVAMTYFRKGDFPTAIAKEEQAIKLLGVVNAPPQVIAESRDRLERLKKAQADTKAAPAKPDNKPAPKPDAKP